MNICLSPCISPFNIGFLTDLIAIHHEVFKECYPLVPVTLHGTYTRRNAKVSTKRTK